MTVAALMIAASAIVQVQDARWRVLEARDIGQSLPGRLFVRGEITAGRFISVGFEVESLADSPDRIFRHPRVMDSRGRTYAPVDDQSSYTPAGKRTIGRAALPPGVPKEFWAVYEVARDSDGLQFEARTLAALGKAQWITLEFVQPKPKATISVRKRRKTAPPAEPGKLVLAMPEEERRQKAARLSWEQVADLHMEEMLPEEKERFYFLMNLRQEQDMEKALEEERNAAR